jgi:drug/metabolite transporter (DMT)-like permease
MAILLALLSALGYGSSDFLAGLLSRRHAADAVSGILIAIELATAGVGVLLIPGDGPHAGALAWGALSGLGGGGGTVMLYRGLAAGQMAVTETLSAVLAAALPALVGLALGDRLGAGAAVGLVIAVPAIALVSWHPQPGAHGGRTGAGYGLLAGICFALLFISLDRAGTRSGAWPVLASQAVGLVVVAPGAVRGLRAEAGGAWPVRDVALALLAGVVVGTAALVFLAATGHGELTIVAVVNALYPAFTVLLARALIGERWSRPQALGLLAAAVSIALVSTG